MKSRLEVRTWGGRRQIPSFETDWRPRGRPRASQHQAMAVALKPPPCWCHPTILLGAIQPFYSIQPLWTLKLQPTNLTLVNPHLVPLLRLQTSVDPLPLVVAWCIKTMERSTARSSSIAQSASMRLFCNQRLHLDATVHQPGCIISLSTREVVAGPRWDAFLVCYNSAEMHYASQVLRS